MGRSNALAQLSREHHHVLVLAKRLRETPPGEEREVASEFREFWLTGGEAHLRREEEALIPPYLDSGSSPAMSDRLLDEHRELREQADHIIGRIGEQGACAHCLSQMGELLAAHVRFEEREFFPALEQALPDDALERIGASLSAA